MQKSTRILFLLMLFVNLVFTSCQKEKFEIIEEPQENALNRDSSLTRLLLRTVMNDGDIDDFIILGDCFTIAFPFTVIINGTEVVLVNEDDYQLIIAILEQTGSTIDDIEIVFPITVILPNYTEIIINNITELEILVAQCVNGPQYNVIDCVDFVYSITIFLYNSDTEITETIVINNDIELYIFLSSQGNNDFITIQYPISVILNDGSVIVVENNQQLENIINECEEIDNITAPLVEYLQTDSWYVAYYYDENDETANYCEFNFVFLSEGTVLASNNTDIYVGSWAVGFDGDNRWLEFDFGNNIPINELNDNWDVISSSDMSIELEVVGGANGGIDYLTIDRIPTICEINASMLEDILQDGQWLIAQYLENGDDRTWLFDSYTLTYNTNNVVVAMNGTNTIYGTWTVTGNTDYLVLILDFGQNIPFNELNDEWNVIEIIVNHIVLESISGTDNLIFEKI